MKCMLCDNEAAYTVGSSHLDLCARHASDAYFALASEVETPSVSCLYETLYDVIQDERVDS